MGRPQCEGTLFFGGGDDVTVSPSSLLGLSGWSLVVCSGCVHGVVAWLALLGPNWACTG